MPLRSPTFRGPDCQALGVYFRRPSVLRWAPALLGTALAASGLLSGCTGGATTTSATSSAPSPASAPGSASSSPSSSAATDTLASLTVSAFPGNTQPDTGHASANAHVTVRDIRIGHYAGFDRVVFEVGGTGTPGWSVRYVDQAISQGSGKPIKVSGKGVLQVTVTGAGYPSDTGVKEYAGPNPRSTAGTHAVTAVAFDGTYEGTTEAFIGTAARTPFRVYRLDSPSRVVVEVADPG